MSRSAAKPALARTLAGLLGTRLPGGESLEFDRDSIIYQPGDPALDVYLVVEGLVSVTRGTPGAEGGAVYLRAANETFGESALLGDGPRGEYARTVLKATVWKWPAGEVKALLASDPQAAVAAFRMLSRRSASLGERLARARPVPRPGTR